MNRCIIDPVLALTDNKLGGEKHQKVFRDAKLAIARAFKVIERLNHLLHSTISFTALDTCLQSPHVVHSALYGHSSFRLIKQHSISYTAALPPPFSTPSAVV